MKIAALSYDLKKDKMVFSSATPINYQKISIDEIRNNSENTAIMKISEYTTLSLKKTTEFNTITDKDSSETKKDLIQKFKDEISDSNFDIKRLTRELESGLRRLEQLSIHNNKLEDALCEYEELCENEESEEENNG